MKLSASTTRRIREDRVADTVDILKRLFFPTSDQRHLYQAYIVTAHIVQKYPQEYLPQEFLSPPFHTLRCKQGNFTDGQSMPEQAAQSFLAQLHLCPLPVALGSTRDAELCLSRLRVSLSHLSSSRSAILGEVDFFQAEMSYTIIERCLNYFYVSVSITREAKLKQNNAIMPAQLAGITSSLHHFLLVSVYLFTCLVKRILYSIQLEIFIEYHFVYYIAYRNFYYVFLRAIHML